MEDALSKLVEAIKGLWEDTVEYLSGVFGESWKNAEQMFAQFDR